MGGGESAILLPYLVRFKPFSRNPTLWRELWQRGSEEAAELWWSFVVAAEHGGDTERLLPIVFSRSQSHRVAEEKF